MESQNNPQNNEKITSKDILRGISILLAILIAFFFLRYNPDNITETPEAPPDVDFSDEVPDDQDVVLPKKTLPLISSETIYGSDSIQRFRELAFKIARKGEVENADLIMEIYPKKLLKKDYMLSITLDNTSGIYRAFREGFSKINLTKTKDLGGVLSEKIIRIPLTKETLFATSGEDFLETQKPNEKFILWNEILINTPVTVFRLLAIPIEAKSGSLSDFSVNKMSIEYSCKDGSDCQLLTCGEEKYYDCIKDNFSKEDADAWYEAFKVN